MPITEEFLKLLMEQNATLLKQLQKRLNKKLKKQLQTTFQRWIQ